LDYSAIGATVNTAARIEAANKDLGTEILISAETYHDLPGKERGALGCDDHARPVHVKGIERELLVHAVHVADEPAGRATAKV
jgi:class 3 adenylate cyclase